MRLLSAALDLVLLPLSVANDIVTAPVDVWIYGNDSQTRQRIEKIEDNLK